MLQTDGDPRGGTTRVLAVLGGGFVALMGVALIFDSLGRVNGIPDPDAMTPALMMAVAGLAVVVWGLVALIRRR